MSHLIFKENSISEITKGGKLKNKRLFSISVHNKRGLNLGEIIHDEQWNCWVWCPEADLRMSEDCLQEIADKLKVTR